VHKHAFVFVAYMLVLTDVAGMHVPVAVDNNWELVAAEVDKAW